MRLIKEILYENDMYNMSFTNKGSDPIKDMGLGVKDVIEKWLTSHNINNYKLTKKYSINVYTYVLLDHKDLTEFPDYIKFNHIVGGFHINNNNLISLKGCPYSITGSFMVSENNLVNLKNGPEIVKESYGASYNKLESLEGLADLIGGSLYLTNNNLKTLEYIPAIIHGDLSIDNNPIETLNYFPSEIEGNLYFSSSEILTKENIQKICEVRGYILDRR
jgi:hypothetical protein